MKKRNPQDATLRNIRALKKKLAELQAQNNTLRRHVQATLGKLETAMRQYFDARRKWDR